MFSTFSFSLIKHGFLTNQSGHLVLSVCENQRNVIIVDLTPQTVPTHEALTFTCKLSRLTYGKCWDLNFRRWPDPIRQRLYISEDFPKLSESFPKNVYVPLVPECVLRKKRSSHLRSTDDGSIQTFLSNQIVWQRIISPNIWPLRDLAFCSWSSSSKAWG